MEQLFASKRLSMNSYLGGINHMLYVQNISNTVQEIPITLQGILGALPTYLEGGNNLAGILAAIIGGFCALKGIGYLESLRKKKVSATFSFEAQLYAHLYELKFMLDQDETLLTGLYSNTARSEWGNKNAASEEKLNQFYTCAKNTFKFIKAAPDQMPVYKNWVTDYTKLIQFLVDILHYDIRNTMGNFKYQDKCPMEIRTNYWKSFCSLLNTLLVEIRNDQIKIAGEIFSDEEATTSNYEE